MWLLKLFLLLVITYTAVVLVMYATQTRLLFPTGLAAVPGRSLPPSSVRLEVATPDGEKLLGVSIPPARDRPGDSLVILGFGGNAWNAEDLAVYLHGLFPDAEVVAFHYRGYRPSTGRPSAAGLLADAPVVYDYVRSIVGTKRVVAVGLSIGTGVAAHLASQRSLDGMILISPFDSLEALAREHFSWVPVGWLLRHHMPTLELVHDLTTPIAIITAGGDTIIAPQRTEAVRRAVPALVLDRTIAGAGHNDLYAHPAFPAAMALALTRIDQSWRSKDSGTIRESSPTRP
jgi:pimeloyl-ACP methyl ester carboxylesterase